MKFLVALQYWDGDKAPAMELLELLQETVQIRNPHADLCVIYRFDSSPPPSDLIEKLNDNFEKVWVIKGHHHCIGYPDGSNGLWESLAMNALLNSTQSVVGAPPWSIYKAILSIESDVCPISKTWLEDLSREWDALRPAHVVGAWGSCGSPKTQHIGHINGNMMFSLDIHKLIPCLTPPGGEAWDTWFAPEFEKIGWAPTTRIVNWFKYPTISEHDFEHLVSAKVAILHGVKDDSVRKLYKHHHAL